VSVQTSSSAAATPSESVIVAAKSVRLTPETVYNPEPVQLIATLSETTVAAAIDSLNVAVTVVGIAVLVPAVGEKLTVGDVVSDFGVEVGAGAVPIAPVRPPALFPGAHDTEPKKSAGTINAIRRNLLAARFFDLLEGGASPELALTRREDCLACAKIKLTRLIRSTLLSARIGSSLTII